MWLTASAVFSVTQKNFRKPGPLELSTHSDMDGVLRFYDRPFYYHLISFCPTNNFSELRSISNKSPAKEERATLGLFPTQMLRFSYFSYPCSVFPFVFFDQLPVDTSGPRSWMKVVFAVSVTCHSKSAPPACIGLLLS